MLELAKIIHEAIGIQSPRLFIGLCILLFGAIGGGLGWAIDKGYRIKLAQEQTKIQSTTAPMPPPPPSVNTTTGPQSPIIPNNSGTVTITEEGSKPIKPPPKE